MSNASHTFLFKVVLPSSIACSATSRASDWHQMRQGKSVVAVVLPFNTGWPVSQEMFPFENSEARCHRGTLPFPPGARVPGAAGRQPGAPGAPGQARHGSPYELQDGRE